MSQAPEPPRLPTRLLLATLRQAEYGAAVVGDLHEEFVRRASRGLRAARWWYARQAVSIAIRYGLESTRRRRRRTPEEPEDSGKPRTSAGGLMFDVRYAIRRLRRDWPFTIPAALVLALGIGANTAMFSVVNRALLQPLPFGDTDRLVNIYQNQGRSAEPVGSSYPAYRDIVRQTDVFTEVTAFTWPLRVRYEDDNRIGPGFIEFATPNYTLVHGSSPALGRWFTPDEDRRGADVVAVVNYRTWIERFGGDPSVLGRVVRIDGVPATVIGIGPQGHSSSLHSGLVTDFWLPVSAAGALEGSYGSLEERRSNEFMVRALLRDGVSLTQARAAMTTLGANLAREYPDEDPGQGISVLRAGDVVVHPQLDAMLNAAASFLMIVVAMLLAIVCTNLATWLMVRGLARGKEVSVRMALGASRGQVVRHLVVESTLLAVLGGTAGYILAVWTMRFVATLDLPIDVGAGLDYRVLGFTLALSLLTGIAFGLAPALSATRGKIASTLRGDGEIGPNRGRRFGRKQVLVAAQVVLSCVFLGVEGVYVRALRAMQDVDLGFDVERLAFVETDAAFAGYSADRITAFHESMRQRAAAIPGVEAATLLAGPPPGWNGGGSIVVDGYVPIEGEPTYLPWIWAGPEYFDALGIPLLRGRGFTDADRIDAPRVAVVNERFARKYLGTPDAVGRRFSVSERSASSDGDVALTEFEVIGVVPDVRTSLQDAPVPLIYRAWRQGPVTPTTVVVRAAGDPSSILVPVQQAVRDLDASVPIVTATTLSQHVAGELGAQSTLVAFLGVLGILGLGLASLGLYAVVSFSVSRRSREIGIRTALGARRTEVIWTLSKDVARLMAVALAVGIGLAWLVVRNLGTLVANLGQEAEGVSLTSAPAPDAVAFALVALIMAAMGLAATVFPAWRATGGRTHAVLKDL